MLKHACLPNVTFAVTVSILFFSGGLGETVTACIFILSVSLPVSTCINKCTEKKRTTGDNRELGYHRSRLFLSLLVGKEHTENREQLVTTENKLVTIAAGYFILYMHAVTEQSLRVIYILQCSPLNSNLNIQAFSLEKLN